jgi:hypothetical protein
MRLFLALFVSSGLVAASPEWIPARWQGGSVESFTGTPVNCLLVPWGKDADPALVLRARERHFAVLGIVQPGADPGEFVPKALEAQLDGLVLEGEFPEGFAARVTDALQKKHSSAVVIPMPAKGRLSRQTAAPVLATAVGAWPRVRVMESGSQAGPSGDPWVDSNIWLVRSLRAWGGSRPIWLGHLPEKPEPPDFPRAVADAAVAGARWIVPSNHIAAVAGYLKFFEEHADWRAFTPAGVVAVVDDPAGKNADMAEENLNLITRRQVPFRIIERPDLARTPLDGLRAVVALDVADPTAAERRKLTAFTEAGGLLLVGPSWKKVAVKKGEEFALEPIGKGRLAIYADEAPDPQALSHELPHLLGRENLGLRIFNVSSVISYLSTGEGRLLLQLVNYATYPVETITVRVPGKYTTARYYTPEGPAVPLSIDKVEDKLEITIPKLNIYGALLLD